MTTNDMLDDGQAREALAAATRAGASGRTAARRWARRYLLGIGAAAGLSTLLIWVIRPYTPPVMWGLIMGALLAGFIALASRQPVTARPKRLFWILLPIYAVVFGLTMAIGPEFWPAYPIGAVAQFAVWAAGAGWVGR